jgi:hypothetical protein
MGETALAIPPTERRGRMLKLFWPIFLTPQQCHFYIPIDSKEMEQTSTRYSYEYSRVPKNQRRCGWYQ